MSAEKFIHLKGESHLPESIALKDLIRVEWTSNGMLLVVRGGSFLVTGTNLSLVLFDLALENDDLDLTRTPSLLGNNDWTVTDVVSAKHEMNLREGTPMQALRVDELPCEYLIFEMKNCIVMYLHTNLIAVRVRNSQEYWFRFDDYYYRAVLPSPQEIPQMGKFTRECFTLDRVVIVSENDCSDSPIAIERRLAVSKISRRLASATDKSDFSGSEPTSFAPGKGLSDIKSPPSRGHDI